MTLYFTRYLISAIFILSCTLATGEMVTVSGTALQHPGAKITLFTFKDLYSQTSEYQASTIIDKEGNFELFCDIHEIEYAYLRFDYLNAYLYLQPGKSYEIDILPLEEKQSKTFSKRTKVPFTFQSLDHDDINSFIIDFNNRYDQFFNNNFELLQKFTAPSGSHFKRKLYQNTDSTTSNTDIKERRSRDLLAEKINKLELRLDSVYIGSDHEFFNVYRKMVLADLQMNINDNAKYIYDNYLRDVPIMLDNPEFIKFFKRYYKRYFAVYAQKWGSDDLRNAVNEKDAETILGLMAKDDFIKDDISRQAVMIHGIYEVRRNRSLKMQNLSEILNYIKESGLTEEIRTMAQCVDEAMKRTKKGFDAYDFTLRNYKNETEQLSEYEGMYVFINFWADWCTSCKKEMEVIKDLHNKYGKHIAFISINMDDEDEKLTNYLSTHKDYNWTFLYGSDDNRLAEEYKLVSLPTFYLINEEGKFHIQNVQKPSEGLETMLYKLFQKKEQEENPKIKVGSK